MNDQLSIFSVAVSCLQDAESALVNLNFNSVEKLLKNAKAIDPGMANLDSTIRICRFLKKNFKDSFDISDFLVNAWLKVPEVVRQNKLLPSEARCADRYLSQIAIQKLGHDNVFIDSEEILHRGSFYSVNEQHSKAHKLFLDTLTTTHPDRADLWGYYGDACFQLKRIREANSAYIRALIIDPQSLDIFRLNYKDLSQLYFRLLQSYSDTEARALLLFNGWIERILEIPRSQTDKGDYNKQIREKVLKEISEESDERLHQFSVCLFLDQSQPPDQIDYEVRERMMELNRDMFARYLERLK
jgi:tetratricopeptide (TPR) repeat protein